MSNYTTVFATEEKIGSLLDQSITRNFMNTLTDLSGKYCAEYVWIGGSGQDLRSKSRTLTKKVTKASELPEWNYDGSSTGQAPGHDSEVYLLPRCVHLANLPLQL
jgi:glutamine synthetase